ncbi:MAG: hypothetical protein ACI35O_16545 [Bacillaceae bacterium]
MMRVEKKRKVRSDKKRDVKPTVSISLKECIDRLSYITNRPIKDISEEICETGLYSRRVIELLAQNFRRNYTFKNTVFIGDLNLESVQKERIKGIKERITMRFTQNTYERINSLSYSLDVTPSKATALLLDATIRNSNFISEFLDKYVAQELDVNRQRELKAILKFINKNNPYDKEVTLSAIVAYYFDEIKTGLMSFPDFLDKLKN